LMLFTSGVMHAADKPNLLIIHTDEHHYNTLGCYGGTIVKTPNIDFLADQGALCTSFYATTPVCSPSRAALFSGLYPHNTPVVTNNIRLSDKVVTFAELLKRRGYATGYAGKWHLDGNGKPQWEPKRNFGFTDNRFMFNRGHWKKFADSKKGPAIGATKGGKPTYGVDGADEKSFSTDWLTTKTIEFIETNKDKPFCYMLSLPDPHGPNSVRAPYDTMYDNVTVPIPVSLNKTAAQTPSWGAREKNVTAAQIRKIMPKYYGMVKCIDDNVGRILKTLRDRKLMDNTIVIFTSDHGDLCGEHGRHNKGVAYEGSARIAFVAYYPKKIKAGTKIDQALSCVDFLPTMMSLMDHKIDLKVQGRDASALFQGKTPGDWNDIAFIRGTKSWLCAVTDRYKLVYAMTGEPWLFDLQKDPNELTNVFAGKAYRSVVKNLSAQLIEYAAKNNDPYGKHEHIKAQLQAAVK
jgi:arylsulfatase A-like enzyme